MRDRIIMAAAEELNYRGFKFTMSDLAKRLSISKSSLYEHFSSKNELITTLINMALADNREQEETIFSNAGLSVEEKFKALLTVRPKLFGQISESVYDDLRNDYPDEWSKVNSFRQNRLDGIISLLEKGIESQAILPINLKVFRKLLIVAINDLFDYRFLADSNMTYQDAISVVGNIIIYGIIPRNDNQI